MTRQSDFTLPTEILEQILEHGFGFLPELVRLIINQAMVFEREQHLRAEAYQRTPERKGQANGFKPKTVKTRVGAITFDVPQVRQGGFYPRSLEKGQRSERALLLAMAEMYVNGVSTRRVAAITEELCGFEVSSTQVSQAAGLLDEELQAWRERPLGRCRYVWLDARYEKVRWHGRVQDAAVLLAVGLNEQGRREILGTSVSLSEHEVHWRTFLKSLTDRGLHGVELVISDAHRGLQAAKQAVFGGAPWQRCQFHLQQNAQAYVPRQTMKQEVAATIRDIFNASQRSTAEFLLQKAVEKYAESAPKLADWLEANIPQGLTVFSFRESHRRRIRTVNGLERLNREIRRRTRVAVLFPSESSCLRLVSALLMEISEEWETGKAYLRLDED